MQAMTAAEAITAHRRIRTGDLHRNQIRALQGQQPANRSAEALASGSPAHEPSALKTVDPARDQLLQQVNAVLALGPHAGEDALPLGCVSHVQLRRIDPAAFGEADRCGTRDSVFESLCDWRPLAILVEIRLAIRQAAHPNHQPTWCPTDLNGFMVESVVPQVTPHALLQLTQGLTGEIGW